MNCVICKHGRTCLGHTTVTLDRDESTVIVRGVPAEICENCGEYYLSDEVTKEILRRTEAVVGNGVEVQILRYAA